MPIPKNRVELLEQLQTSYTKLQSTMENAGDAVFELHAIDDWNVADLLAVRAWWTEKVAKWVVAGRENRRIYLPARGYRWNQTPQLNAAIVTRSRTQSFRTIRNRLARGYSNLLLLIADLTDEELFGVGVFSWAGKWPIARWISINTTRQYSTATTLIRKALRTCR